MKKALIVVDVQNDFINGSLAVPKGEEVVPVCNRLITSCKFALIVATQDWHVPGHKSFASSHPSHKVGDVIDLNGVQQFLWPDHCIWGEKGSEFHKDLLIGRVNLILRKGFNPEVDSYSGFLDNVGNATGLRGYLNDVGMEEIYVAGLATDYCVKYTAVNAAKEFRNVYLIEDACRAVNVKPTDGQDAIDEMRKVGVKIIDEKEALK